MVGTFLLTGLIKFTQMLKLLYINMVGTFLLTDLIKFTQMLKLLFTNG